MKRLSFLFAILLMATVPFLTSCSQDETTPTPPTIMLNAGPGYTSSDVTVPVNTDLKVGVIASSTSAKLTNLKITQTISGLATTIKDTAFSSDTYNQDFTITAPSTVGNLTLTFLITAADGESAQTSFVITTTSAPIYTYTAVLLGGQENPNMGSFYSTGADSVMKLAVARQNSDQVDLVYYYGATNKASIVAVSDAQLQSVPSFVECSTWTTQNETKFKLTSGVNWSTIVDESGILANASDLTVTHINQLAVGDIVSFVTAATSSNPGKNGMYKVMEINGSGAADRSITIEVKIQQ
jgi:hypothetical protein